MYPIRNPETGELFTPDGAILTQEEHIGPDDNGLGVTRTAEFYCVECRTWKPVLGGIAPGYATHEQGPICYECCGGMDRRAMAQREEATLYLHKDDDGWFVQNWPGTLKIPIARRKAGKHNLAKTRLDVWFSVGSVPWWGVQYGESSELVHCKRIGAKR